MSTVLRKSERKGPWIQTHSGRAYYPQDPQMSDILIDDIAHALSMQCRFVGHCSRFYSVAEHSIHVSQLCAPEHQLAGLLHDAQEAYLHDIASPIKKSLLDYQKMEAVNWFVIACKFGLSEELPGDVKKADSDMLFVERRALFAHTEGLPSWSMGAVEPDPYPDVGPIGWPQHIAKQRFYDRFFDLTNKKEQAA